DGILAAHGYPADVDDARLATLIFGEAGAIYLVHARKTEAGIRKLRLAAKVRPGWRAQLPGGLGCPCW
nr:hypothetical protein [Tanacetum cinerariifolium]